MILNKLLATHQTLGSKGCKKKNSFDESTSALTTTASPTCMKGTLKSIDFSRAALIEKWTVEMSIY